MAGRADTDWIVLTLVHDIGDIFAPHNHYEYAATIMRPFVREQCIWVVEKQSDFQMSYYAQHVGVSPSKREVSKDHPYHNDYVTFCERCDQTSHDPDYVSKPLEIS